MAEILKQQLRNFDQATKPYLYENGPFQSQWSFVEQKLPVKRQQIALGLLGFAVLYLAFGWGNDFLSNLIGFFYPAYASLLLVQSNVTERDTNWLVYWVVFSFLGLIEYIAHDFVHSLWFYWLGKTIFLLWLMRPGSSGGSNVLYQRVLGPLVHKGQRTSSTGYPASSSGYAPSAPSFTYTRTEYSADS